MGKYDIAVVEYPSKRLAGMKVRTTMQKTQFDSPALWQSFGPRMGELPAGLGYGYCIMINEEELDYWAAMEVEAAVPDGMDCVFLPGGLYAKCEAANLEALSGVYTYLYMEWGKDQTQYAVDGWAPCFELYTPDWEPDKPFTVYVAVKKL